ncbi:MAG: hypothetical protein ACLQVF_13460 [Isosphaeraceae bacterium]
MIDRGRQTSIVPAEDKLGRLRGIQEAWIKATRPFAQSQQQRLRDRDESDPYRSAVELAQRGRMIVDVATVDLEAAEAAFGPFHPTTWHFRNALNEARRSWERLRAELGTKAIDAALREPPLVVLTLARPADGSPRVVLVSIAGQTYRTEKVVGTEAAPIQWRLTRLLPPLDHGPYYVCRLADGLTQCDCADWIFQIAESVDCRKTHCKHLAALSALGWI